MNTLYLTTSAATLCLIVGLGWGYLFSDWVIGMVLILIGLANLVRSVQIYKHHTTP